MSGSVRTILQVNAADVGGGAERVASDLQAAYLRRGLDAWMAVGCKKSDSERVFEIPNDAMRAPWARGLERAAAHIAAGRSPAGARRLLSRALLLAAEPRRYAAIARGEEDVFQPGTARIPALPPAVPDVIHYHNLHGYYFDIRRLPTLTASVPSVITMHDAWLLTGHCAHPFDCPRWCSGCGECPDLGVYVPIRADASAKNWRMKHEALRESRLGLATPSQWLMEMVQHASILSPESEARVIPNGVDIGVFSPGDREQARLALGLPAERRIVLFAANRVKDNPFKDFGTLAAALPAIAAETGALLVALGSDALPDESGLPILHVPFQADVARVADYYRAADVYVHAARAENLPLAVIEALACGTPVVASHVGGIPEIVEAGVSGDLVRPGDPERLASAVVALLGDDARRGAYSEAGLARVHERFTLERQADAYLAWYDELTERWSEAATRLAGTHHS